jgi:hypothetical protein
VKLYKSLAENGFCCHGGTGQWSLPNGKKPGAWMPKLVDLNPCHRGYHVLREQDLLTFVGPALFEVEVRGEKIICDDKVVVAEARLVRHVPGWTHQNLVIFACDCAERVLSIFEKTLPDDKRTRAAIEAARKWAAEPTDANARAARAAAEEETAAWAARAAEAGAAARAGAAGAAAEEETAAWAAEAAARAAEAGAAAEEETAAWAAAAAARAAAAAARAAAAWAAARAAAAAAAARAKERKWQIKHLCEVMGI